MSNGNAELTTEEIIALVNRSTLPVVLVEGKTDAAILRLLESFIGEIGSILPCGGRQTLFQLVERSEEITNARIAFLADQDMFCINGGHLAHPKLVYTWGYSIENDIIAGSKIDRLILPAEASTFDEFRWLAARYFSFEYEKSVLEGRAAVWDVSLESVIDPGSGRYRSHIPFGTEISTYNSIFCRRLYRSIKRLLRGKQLVELYLLVLDKPKRVARLNGQALLHCCSTLGSNIRLRSLAESLRAKIRDQNVQPTGGAAQ
jgi:hypothetical protein